MKSGLDTRTIYLICLIGSVVGLVFAEIFMDYILIRAWYPISAISAWGLFRSSKKSKGMPVTSSSTSVNAVDVADLVIKRDLVKQIGNMDVNVVSLTNTTKELKMNVETSFQSLKSMIERCNDMLAMNINESRANPLNTLSLLDENSNRRRVPKMAPVFGQQKPVSKPTTVHEELADPEPPRTHPAWPVKIPEIPKIPRTPVQTPDVPISPEENARIDELFSIKPTLPIKIVMPRQKPVGDIHLDIEDELKTDSDPEDDPDVEE